MMMMDGSWLRLQRLIGFTWGNTLKIPIHVHVTRVSPQLYSGSDDSRIFDAEMELSRSDYTCIFHKRSCTDHFSPILPR